MNSTTAKTITKRQLFLLHVVRRRNGQNTHGINAAFGGNSAYESNLRDRLYTLESYGLVKSFERKGKRTSHVVARNWYLTQRGLEITNRYASPKYDCN